jgi:hypothetical protein
MTWAALIFTPLVIGYQAWTYWVFRQRISAAHTNQSGCLRVRDVKRSPPPPRCGAT